LCKDNAPQNLSLLKKIVLNLIRLDTTDKTKARLRPKRKGAAWDDDVRMNMRGLTSLWQTSSEALLARIVQFAQTPHQTCAIRPRHFHHQKDESNPDFARVYKTKT